MTFEEIQKTIEGMLAVQKELQLGQLKIQQAQERERETIEIMVEEMAKLIEVSHQNERRIEQLIGLGVKSASRL